MSKTPYERSRESKKQEQMAGLRRQKEDTQKTRRESRGEKIKKGGFLGLYENISSFFLSLFGGGETPGSAQKSLPYERMWRDGLCLVSKKENLYSRSIQFYDINYRLSEDARKSRIFNLYCSLLNSVDSEVHLELSFHNRLTDLDELKRDMEISPQGDELDEVRAGYSEYLKEQLSAGRNEIQREKFVTFSVHADSAKEARIKLHRVESDLLHQLHSVMKVPAKPLRGADRLRIMQEVLRDNPKEKLNYDFTAQGKAGLTSKDAIAPSSFDFRHKAHFSVGNRYACASFFQIEANRLYDNVLSDFLDVDGELIISIHLEPIQQEKALRTVKRKISDIDQMKAEQNKKAVEQGIDMDIMPTDINTYGNEARAILDGLETKDERMFLLTFLVINLADSKTKMDSYAAQAKTIASGHNCVLKRLDFQQEQGFGSALPLGRNLTPIKRQMMTTGVAGLVPFVTEDLYMGKGSLHYGRNPLSQRMVLVNRKALQNPNALILGIPGSGKSVAAKLEMAEVALSTNDEIIVVDPESEYHPLIRRLGGQVMELSATSPHHINPMDMSLSYGEGGDGGTADPLILKAGFLLGLFEIILDGNMSAVQRSVIDECIVRVYQPYLADPKPENTPLLEDLHRVLTEHENAEAAEVAAALKIYVTGSLRIFNHPTDVNMENRLLCFDIKNLTGKLKELGMLILQDHVWNRVSENRDAKKYTWYFVDEFHLLLRTPQTAEFAVSCWKRMRKFFCLPTGITQNVADFLNNPNAAAVETILSNTPFIRMLEQTHADSLILARFLDISADQMSYVDSPPIGQGLMKCGGTILPFNNRLPEDNILYPYITTKPSDAA